MTNEMHNSYNQFYSTVFRPLYMFRTNLDVHHQERDIIYCITQFGTIGTIVQASLAAVHHQEHCIIYCITQFGTIGTIGTIMQASPAAKTL